MMLLARLLLFFVLVPGVLQAQALRIGIYLDQQTAVESLPASFFLIDGIQNPQMISSLLMSKKPVWVASGLTFTRSYDLRHHPDSLSNALLDPIFYYRRTELSVESYILGSHPQKTSDLIAFFDESLPELRNLTEADAAILTTPESAAAFEGLSMTEIVSLADYHDLQRSSGYKHVFLLPEFVQSDPAYKLRYVLDQAIANNQNIIIPLSLLEHLSEHDPQIWPLLQEYTTADTPVFAIGTSPSTYSASNELTGILLLGSWLVLGLFFFANGAYHRSVTRYFFTHNFYVNDVMNRRLKPESEVLAGFLVTGLFGGLFAVTLHEQLDIWLVGKLMDVHGPAFFGYLQSTAATFIVGALATLTVITATILWLTAAGARNVSMSQATQIVLYPMHIIVPFATALAIFQLNEVSGVLSLLVGMAGLFSVFLCMPLCSLDIRGFLTQHQARFTLAGPVLYMVVLTSVLLWILFFTPSADMLLLLLDLLK